MKLTNKKSYFNYFVIQSMVSGLVLRGSEVKSIMNHDMNFGDSYITFINGELFVKNMRIAQYKNATYQNHDEMRDKKILLNKREIRKISKLYEESGVSIIPLEIFIMNNKIKLKIGICRGKKSFDKRDEIKKKDIEREYQRKF